MDYYEELGLEPNASPEQIRQAYRDLVKLLHPDHHQGRARELAERQMLRLNAILTTLTDPHLRKLYDAQRAGRLAVVPAAESGQRRGRLRATLAAPAGRAWLLAGALGLGGLFWVSRQGAPAAGPLPSAGPTTPAPAAAQAGRPAPAGRRNPESEPRSGARRNSAFQPRASASADQAVEGVAPIGPGVFHPPAAAAAAALPAPELPGLDPGEMPPAAAPPFGAGEAPPPPLAGRWFYVPSKGDPERADLYPPEYIELAIQEREGRVQGRYRARYRISDRPIAPEISFQFEGPAGGSDVRLPWMGPGGARGELRLRLISSEALEIHWWATELGATAGLASGTAVLVRRREP